MRSVKSVYGISQATYGLVVGLVKPLMGLAKPLHELNQVSPLVYPTLSVASVKPLHEISQATYGLSQATSWTQPSQSMEIVKAIMDSVNTLHSVGSHSRHSLILSQITL